MQAFLRILVLGLLLAAGYHALAQDKTPEMPPRLSAIAAKIDDISKSVRDNELDDSALLQFRTQLEPLSADNQAILEELQPLLEAARQRLEQLGAKPAANEPPESAEAAKTRAENQKAFDDLDTQIKRARVLSVRVTQVGGDITNARRELLLGEIFKPTSSAFNPSVWYNASLAMPRVSRTLTFIVSDLFDRIQQRLKGARLLRFIGAVLILTGLYAALRYLVLRFVIRKPRTDAISKFQKTIAAIWVALTIAILPIAVAMAFVEILKSFDLITPYVTPFIAAVLDVVRMISVCVGLARGLFAPGRPEWRLLSLHDDVARRYHRLALNFVCIVAALRLMESINQIVSAPLDISIAVRSLLTISAAIVMANSLFGAARSGKLLDIELGPILEKKRDWFSVWWLAVWAAIIGIIGANIFGYINFANFMITQIMWVTFILVVAYLLYTLANEAIGQFMNPNSAIAQAASTALGVGSSALKQISILLSGLVSLMIYFISVLLILAPWGVESNSIFDTLQAAFFGFSFGALSFSLSGVVIAIVLFFIGFIATRAFQRWLEKNYLPSTELDSGLQNSITTSAGYAGALAAIALPFAYLGFSFDKLAIVAGALSVGIGFGLQSIVNNFVSGLILLWERAVKVGDWVVVGSDQGIVKRINVRSTEIETFERQTVIVPNSNLISGVVKNWVRMDRNGRFNLEIKVDYKSDPEDVRDILVACAINHPHVLQAPAPSVMFTEFANTTLNFDLRCFVDDVDHMGRTRSDLRFEIFRRFRAAGIIMPPP